MWDATLKQKLQCKLNLTRGSRRLNLAESRRADIVVGNAEVHPVQDIEEFPPKLQSRGLCQPEVLRHREVPLRKAGSLNDIAAGIAEGSELRILLERRGIEPLAR